MVASAGFASAGPGLGSTVSQSWSVWLMSRSPPESFPFRSKNASRSFGVLESAARAEILNGWFAGLKGRLESLDLSRALRASQLERHYVRTPAAAAPGSGARKYVK